MIKFLFFNLSILFLFFTSCSGQVKKPATSQAYAKLPQAYGLFKDASVSCAIQDKAGNIWLGTNGEGLFCFDGKTFKRFTEKDGLDNLIVYSLFQDKTGNIWAGTKTGLCRYNGNTFAKVSMLSGNSDKQYIFTANNKVPSSPNGVWSMMQDKKGTIWFGSDSGVYCYDGRNFKRFLDGVTNKNNLHLKAIFSLLEDRNGNIWFGSCIGEGLIRFNGKTLEQISPKNYARTQNIIEDKHGNIWFASLGKGMCRYDGTTITTNFFKENNTYDILYVFLKDRADRLWFSEPANGRPLRLYADKKIINFSEKHSKRNKVMYPVLEDRAGNIWLATHSMGLYKWDGKAIRNFSKLE
ncbi:MAG TPA: two-component regulator propeller domain-containing protein [Flavipsychrobacter sp.]|nr:two-component regulator propeller domain-containing protein [Flavipsychrobacter sp.]